jgi:hypothetical protein
VTDHSYRPQRNWGARIREVIYQSLRLIVIENELLRIGVLAGKGADIVELNYKPRDLDFVWLAPGGVRSPIPHAATAPDNRAVFRETYPGGWQEIFPNGGAPSSHEGAAFGQHGEVCFVPWDVTIVEDRADEVVVRFSVQTRTVPCRIEKTIRLRAGEAGFRLDERLRNDSPVAIRAMWGHHITFGAPFLIPGSRIELPDGIAVVPHPEPIAPGGRRVAATDSFPWPRDPQTGLDLRQVPEPGAPSEQLYLSGFADDHGRYQIVRPDSQLGCRISWDAGQMPFVWFWQDFGRSVGYPWYGRLMTVGLEPFSSFPNLGLADAVTNGSALTLQPGEERAFWLRMAVLDGALAPKPNPG